MGIQFTEHQWDEVRKSYGSWWNHVAERPLISVVLQGVDPGRPKPKAPLLNQSNALDLTFSAEEIVDRMDYELSRNLYLGDAFPHVNLDSMGPGVLSAFLGAVPDNSTGSIWFEPQKIRDLKDIHLEYDPENIWLKRVKDIYRAGNKLWKGNVIMGMVDLGGVMDVLAVFRSTEKLLMDLYDEPDEVKRLISEIHDLWMHCYNDLNCILETCSRGYTDWSRVYSEKRSYVIQSDFSFMIGNDMFREFVLEEIARVTEIIPNTLFHLDGPGEIRHLDDLLKLDNLNAVQWVPGAGAPSQSEWPDIYQKIHRAGKGIQVWEGFRCVDAVAEQIGTFKGIQQNDIVDDLAKKEEYERMLARYR